MPPPPEVEKDLEELQALADRLTNGTTLKMILEEVIGVIGRVYKWKLLPQGTTGGSTYQYFKEATSGGYEVAGYCVQYTQGDLGNLVHELTHVAVNEAYQADFVIQPKRPNSWDGHPTYAKVKWPQGLYVCSNAEALMRGWRNPPQEERSIESVNKLIGFADRITNDGQSAQIQNKLQENLSKITTDYDPPINQILVWLQDWGYCEKEKESPEKKFYDEVDKRARKAYEARQAARQAPSSHTPHTPSVSSASGDPYAAAIDFPGKTAT